MREREREGFLGEGEEDEREARAIAKHHERACRSRRTKIGFYQSPFFPHLREDEKKALQILFYFALFVSEKK